jgi:hypothetical protein
MKRQKLSTSCAPSNNVLFEDLFHITSLDNSKFEKVGRIRGRSSGFDANIILDVNINIYPLEPKQVSYGKKFIFYVTIQNISFPPNDFLEFNYLYNDISSFTFHSKRRINCI